MKCDRCSGTIDADGYCDVCGHKMLSPDTPPSINKHPHTGEGTELTWQTASTRATTTRRVRLREDLVEIPPIPPRNPAAAVLQNPEVSEDRRHCPECNSPVGRSRAGQPGRAVGYCSKCGHPYCFTPKLRDGELVGGQYEIVGCIAHGGLGWVYLARDRPVDHRWVVLKGLLNSNDADAQATALLERRFLAEVAHPNIVRIYNFVEHDDDGYIVMEHVDGQSLKGLLEARAAENEGKSSPLLVEHAIWYILKILPALGYLHDLGLIFCDFKPDNVMQVGKDVKLIDLGGVYNLADPKGTIYRTVGYDAPEYRDTGPTVASDLYSVGRTLAVLCTNFRGYQDTYASTLPPPAEVPLYATFDSLYRFLARATAERPDDRFQSADEMAAQLEGVLHEIVATQRRHPVPATSTLFTSELHGQVEGPPWRSLPSLLVANDDPAAGFLATIAAEPNAIDLLRSAPEQTVEVQLRLARALIDEEAYDMAIALLDEVHAGDPWEWRTDWYRGIAHLEMGDAASACEDFERVYYEVPGELAPKAALALAAEAAGDPVTSAGWADIVSRVDPSFTSAAMCLARDRLTAGDRNRAIEAYDRVPASSSAYRDAQNAKVEALLRADVSSGGPASVNDLLRAAEIVARLPQGSDERERLAIDVFSAALRNLQLHGPSPNGMRPVILSRPFTERGIREGLEATYRSLARRSQTASERIALVDRANSVRPRTVV